MEAVGRGWGVKPPQATAPWELLAAALAAQGAGTPPLCSCGKDGGSTAAAVSPTPGRQVHGLRARIPQGRGGDAHDSLRRPRKLALGSGTCRGLAAMGAATPGRAHSARVPGRHQLRAPPSPPRHGCPDTRPGPHPHAPTSLEDVVHASRPSGWDAGQLRASEAMGLRTVDMRCDL